MQDAHALAPDFEHVEIAIGVKGVARVVARDHDRNARRLELVQRGDAAPARGAARLSVLQEHIAHRQRNDVEPRARGEIDGALRFALVPAGERAAMADEHAAAEAVIDRSLSDRVERTRRRVRGFVDVKVEIAALARGEAKETIERFGKARRHVRHRAQDLRSMRLDHRLDLGHMALVEDMVDGEQRRSLQLDPPAPALARLGEHRPADPRLRAQAVDMGADRARSPRVGAAQPEIHAPGDVGGAPVGLPVLGDGRQRVGEGAGRIGRPAPDVALVEMGVRVDERRQNDPAGEREARQVRQSFAAARRDRRDAFVLDDDVDPGEAVAIERRRLAGKTGGQDARVGERVTRRLGEGESRVHVSRPRALSCQWRSSR